MQLEANQAEYWVLNVQQKVCSYKTLKNRFKTRNLTSTRLDVYAWAQLFGLKLENDSLYLHRQRFFPTRKDDKKILAAKFKKILQHFLEWFVVRWMLVAELISGDRVWSSVDKHTFCCGTPSLRISLKLLRMMHFDVALEGDIYSEKNPFRELAFREKSSEKNLLIKSFREASNTKKFALLVIINGTSWTVLVVV